MSFTYLGRNCPICNGDRLDCRRNNGNGIIHCRDGSANPIGWHLIKEDAQGFYMWGEGDGHDAISSEEKERRHQEQKLERQRRDEEKRRGALPVSERDTAIRKLHKHFGLAYRHRADLKRRGLTDEQIDKLTFFTIQPGEWVPNGIPENLPGVKNGRSWGTEGFACHALNPQGQAIGYQTRLDNPNEGGKYRWAKGAVSSHLPNGELPITYCRPLDGVIKRKAIGMAEGILKPAIASQKLGQIFIGAAGFLFSKDVEVDGKPERVPLDQLKEYLEAASAELGTKDVEVYPDGGVVENPQMYQKYQWIWNALTQLGYNVRIVWWGQFKKDKPDCDELPEAAELKLISPGKFADYAKRFGGADSPYQQKVRREWRKNRTFTPDITDSSKWVNWALPSAGTIFFGRAGLGRGKTTQLKKWVGIWRAEDPNTRFFVLGYRNTLLLQTASQLGFVHIHDGDASLLRADEHTSFCLCVDSLLKFQAEDFDDSVIFLDESMSVVKHLLLSPTIPKFKRDQILELFSEAIRRARTVIGMDGLLADWAVNYLAAICPEKKIIKAHNTYKADKPAINFLVGTQGLDEKLKPNDRSPWVKLMLEAPVLVICSDSQIFLEAMEEYFQKRGAKTLRIDSKTVTEDYAKEFLADCNKYIKDHKIDVLLYSPSAESGLDVSLKGWFTDHFGFFFGVLGVDAIIQMMGRIRDPEVKRFVWCKEWVAQSERSHTKSPFVEEVERTLGWLIQEEIIESIKRLGASGELSDENLDLLWDKVKQMLKESCNTPHFRASCLITAIENAEKANLRSFLREALLKEGYGIHELILPSFDAEKELEKNAKEEVKRRNSRDIFTAPVKDEEIPTLVSTRSQFDAKWEDRCRRIKAVLLDRLPGIRDSGVWDEDFIYLTRYEEPDFISRQELFWLYNNPEEAAKEGIRRLHWFARCDKTFIGDIRSRFLKIEAYRKLEIHRFFDLDKTWHNDSPEIQDLLERCKNPAIAKILGHPGKLSGIQKLSRLLEPLGIFLKSFRPHEGARFYRVDSEEFFNPSRLEIIRAIGRRYEKAKSEEKPLDWNQIFEPSGEGVERSTSPYMYLINNGSGGAAETIDNTTFQPKSGFFPLTQSGQVICSVCDNTEKSPEKSDEGAIGKNLEEFFEASEKSMTPQEIFEAPEKSEALDEIFEAAEKSGVHVGNINNISPTVDTTPEEKSHIHSRVGNCLLIIPNRMKPVAAVTTVGVAATTIAVPAAAAPQDCGTPMEIREPAEIPQSAENSPTPLEFLIDRLAAVNNQQEFWQIVEGHDSERIEDAILYQEPCHRTQLRRWYQAPVASLSSQVF